jgi:Rrf2 family protein
MKKSSRISVALHAILHLSIVKLPVTSEHLGQCQNTNAVQIRRILGDLKKAGILDSEKGHGGGWVLLKKPSDITFQMVFEALGESLLPSPINLSKNESCLIMHSLCSAMDDFIEDADILMAKKLSKISIQSLINKIPI